MKPQTNVVPLIRDEFNDLDEPDLTATNRYLLLAILTGIEAIVTELQEIRRLKTTSLVGRIVSRNHR